MRKKHEIVGQTFNSLSVLGKSDRRNPSGKLCWYLCLCVCGNKTEVQHTAIVKGYVKSCGCFRKNNWNDNLNNAMHPPGDASFHGLYAICRRAARTRNLTFSLSENQHKRLVQGNCFYCGANPKPYNHYLRLDGTLRCGTQRAADRAWILANGVDRLDSALGYELANCVTCCYDCNVSKAEMLPKVFIEHCRSVVAYQETLKSSLS